MPHHPQATVDFPDQPDVLDRGDRVKVLHSPYRCTWEHKGQQVRLTVPAGFVYNGASVPQLLWSIYPPHALDRAAVFHDFLYRGAGLLPYGAHEYLTGLNTPGAYRWVPITARWTRAAADRLFFEQLRQDPKGPGWVRQRMAYAMVRAFGGGRWGPSSPDDFEERDRIR